MGCLRLRPKPVLSTPLCSRSPCSRARKTSFAARPALPVSGGTGRKEVPMYIYKKIRVKLNERVVAFRNSLPVRALGTGVHLMWGTKLSEQRWDSDALMFNALPEVRAVMPAAWFAEVTIAENQRGILYRDGKPRVFMRPGVHRYWTVDPSVALRVLSIEEPMPKLSDELVAVLPASEYVYAVVREHERGLQYVHGRLVGVLAPG